jgi:EamA domain-containing membrane protein RarD
MGPGMCDVLTFFWELISAYNHIALNLSIIGVLLNVTIVDEVVALAINICTAGFVRSGGVIVRKSPHVGFLRDLKQDILNDPPEPQ